MTCKLYFEKAIFLKTKISLERLVQMRGPKAYVLLVLWQICLYNDIILIYYKELIFLRYATSVDFRTIANTSNFDYFIYY